MSKNAKKNYIFYKIRTTYFRIKKTLLLKKNSISQKEVSEILLVCINILTLGRQVFS